MTKHEKCITWSFGAPVRCVKKNCISNIGIRNVAVIIQMVFVQYDKHGSSYSMVHQN